MEVGDLVKVKFIGVCGSIGRSMAREFPADEPGIVIEEAENAAKVLFPSLGSIRSFLKSSLEVLK